jgi:hypothetical protein
MKDAVLTVRLPSATRRKIEAMARREGRSMSQQVEQLILRGMEEGAARRGRSISLGPRSLAGVFQQAVVPDLDDFQVLRRELSSSLNERSRRGGTNRRR